VETFQRLARLRFRFVAAVAQLVEHMICNLEVVGSSPIGGFV